MNKIIGIFSVVILVTLISSFAFAAGGTLTKFVVTIEQLDISRDGGRTWKNVHSGASRFDMLALSGGNASQWFSNVEIPAGTYNKWRVHVTYFEATVTGDSVADPANADGVLDSWQTGNMNAVVDANGNTSATWNLDAENSFIVHSATAIELDPQITVE